MHFFEKTVKKSRFQGDLKRSQWNKFEFGWLRTNAEIFRKIHPREVLLTPGG